MDSAPRGSRTPNLLIRSQYPILTAHVLISYSICYIVLYNVSLSINKIISGLLMKRIPWCNSLFQNRIVSIDGYSLNDYLVDALPIEDQLFILRIERN